MKTLAQLLDQHQITKPADRLEFEEVVNEVTRQHGAALQSAKLNCDRIVADTKEEAQSLVTEERAEKKALQEALAALQEKTALAVNTAKQAIDDALNPESPQDAAGALDAIAAVIDEVTKDARTREREALEAQQAEIAARLAALG